MQKTAQELNFVSELLNEKAKLSDLSGQVAYDLASLRDIILKLELRQEIQILRTIFQSASDLSSFQAKFKQRCLERLQDTVRNISFEDMPESDSNCLYWDIALKEFKPQTMKEMIAILLGDGFFHLEVDIALPRDLSLSKRERHKHPGPVVKLSKHLDAFAKAPPALKTFTHYAIADNLILNINEIKDFRLTWHDKLKKLLDEQYPKLSRKLYTHNTSLQILVNDILVLNYKGTTPRTAIKQLIQEYDLGGTNKLGSTFATQEAEHARKLFLAYFYGLPADLQKQLRALKAGDLDLSGIIDVELEQAECTITVSGHLTKILDENATNVLLNTLPAMTTKDLAKLEAKYGETQDALLNCKKDSLIQSIFPTELTKQAIQGIVLNVELLIFLLLKSPATFYDTLLGDVKLHDSNKKLIQEILFMICKGSFSSEQRKALASAFAKHYRRFHDPDTILVSAIETNDMTFAYEVFVALPKEEKLPALKETDKLGHYTVLHFLVERNDVKTLHEVFISSPTELTKQAIQGIVLNVELLIFLLLNSPSTLYDTLLEHVKLHDTNKKLIQEILSMISKGSFSSEQRKALASAFAKHYRRFHDPDTILVSVIETNDMTFVYEFFIALPKEEKLQALKETDNLGHHTVLHVLAERNDIKTLCEVFVSRPTDNLRHFKVLHLLAKKNDIKTLIAILDHLPEQRLQLIQEKDDCSRSIANYLVQTQIESLKAIIDHFPDCRVALFQELVNDIIQKMPRSVTILMTVLDHFPDHRLQLLQMKNDSGMMVIHSVVQNEPLFVIKIIGLLSEKEQILLLKSEYSKHISDGTMIFFFNRDLKDLLLVYNLLIGIRDAKNNAPFFTSNKEALELMAAITKSDSYDAIKRLLMQYVIDATHSLISREVCNRLIPEVSVAGRLDALKKRWALNIPTMPASTSTLTRS